MNRVFLIHGLNGSPKDHWFPWLSGELTAKYVKIFSPSMPSPSEPKVKDWIQMIKGWVGELDEQTFFVGHSLGCIAILRYLASLRKTIQAGGCVFVGGFSGNISVPEISEFYEMPLNIEKAKERCMKFSAIMSDNDDRVPLNKAIEFAKLLNAKIIIEKGKGHFRGKDGVFALPSVLSELERMMNEEGASR